VWTCSFNTGKIDTELDGNSSRDRRRFHARFFAFLDLRCRLFSFSLLFRSWCGALLLFFFLRGLCLSFFFFFLFGFRLGRCFFFFCFLFLFFLFFSGRFFPFATDECVFVAAVYLASFFDINLGDRSVFVPFSFSLCCLGRYYRNHFSRC